jgi:hypothetical protein
LVTSKLDVRQAVVNLPEETRDLEDWGESNMADDDKASDVTFSGIAN